MNSWSCASLKNRSWRRIIRSAVEKLELSFVDDESRRTGLVTTGATDVDSAPLEVVDSLLVKRGVVGDSGVRE